MAYEGESTAGHELTFDEELLLWLGDEPPGVRAADAERVRDIAGEFACGFDGSRQKRRTTAARST